MKLRAPFRLNPGAVPAAWFVLVILAIVGVDLLARRLIGIGYRGEGPDVLNTVFEGRSQHPLEYYLAVWRSVARVGLLWSAVASAVLWAWRWRLGAIAIERTSAFRKVSPLGVLGLSLCFGTLSGLVEGGDRMVRHLIERDPARLFTWEITWMAPLSAGVAFLFIALGLLALARLFGLRAGPRIPLVVPVVVFWLAVPALYGPLQNPRLRLADYAIALLSLGLGAGAARLSAPTGGRFVGLARRSAAPLIAICIVSTIVGIFRLPSVIERRRLADLPPSVDRPNVLLIILDTVRAQNLGMYGYPRLTTPNLDDLASGGIVFDKAIATSPWTLPSHASVFTGRFPFQVSADFGSPLDDRSPTLAEVLRDAGYATAGFTANYHYTTEASGLSRGFARYEDFPITIGRFFHSSWLSGKLASQLLPTQVRVQPRKSAERVTDAFLVWAEKRDQRPFFAFLNYMDAHGPYESPPEFSEMFQTPGHEPKVVDGSNPVTIDELEGTLAAYDGAIAYIDQSLGRLIDRLDRDGVLDRTVVVVASDHGEQFGEHSLMYHGNSLYMPLLHVPLIMAYPAALEPGLRVSAVVSIRDIPTTILDLVGIADRRLGGESLARLWEDPNALGRMALSELNDTSKDLTPSFVPVARGPMKSILVEDLHYIRNGDDVEEIYDLSRDPHEGLDLFPTFEGSQILVDLRAALDSLGSETEGG